jgi:hypothetical protein
MRPRYEEQSEELTKLLKDAKSLEERLQKSQPGFDSQKEGSTQGPSHFETQPGKVKHAFYNTNGVVPEVEDVKNKGSISENSSVLDKNPYFPTAFSSERLIDGGKGPIMKSLGGDVERMAVQDLKKSVDRLARRLN